MCEAGVSACDGESHLSWDGGCEGSKAFGTFLLGFRSSLGVDSAVSAKQKDPEMQVINHDG